MEVYGKTFTGLIPNQWILRPVFVEYLGCYVCDMTVICFFLILCLDFSKSYNDFSFHLLKTEIIKTAE